MDLIASAIIWLMCMWLVKRSHYNPRHEMARPRR